MPVDEQPTRTDGARFKLDVADVAFVLVLVGTFLTHFVWSSAIRINSDDWLIAPRGNTIGDYFLPYEENLSVIPIAVYHLFFVVFGFGTYWPLRVIGISSHLAIAVTLYLIIRARLGAVVGLLIGVIILWYPRVYLYPAVFNHWFAVAASIICAWALTREGRRFDLLVAGALLFALCSSGVGVAGAIGCVAYVVISRAPLGRWIAVGVPTALWALWRVTLAAHDQEPTVALQSAALNGTAASSASSSLSSSARFVLDGVINSFQMLATGNRLLGEVLAVAFFLAIGWQARHGIRAAAHPLAWTLAMIGWWVGLAYERGTVYFPGAGPGTFRYRLAALAFAAVALTPRRVSAATLRRATSAPALVAAILLSALFVAVNGPTTLTQARDLDPSFDQSLQKTIVANMGPAVVADDQLIWLSPFSILPARDYRALVALYGPPEDSTPSHPDAALVALGNIRPVAIQRPAGACTPLVGPLTVRPDMSKWHKFNPVTRVVLTAGDTDVTVELHRFERSGITIGRIPAGTTARIGLPDLMSETPWIVQATGACHVDG